MNNSKFRCKNLRIGRQSTPDQIYMITTVTHERRKLFDDFSSGRLVVRALQTIEPSAETLAFVVMPDHMHWLMQLKNRYSLSQTIQYVKSYSARTINTEMNRKGAIWSKGYFEHALRREEDVISCARYIVANPLRAGLVEQIGDYPLLGCEMVGGLKIKKTRPEVAATRYSCL